MSAEMLIYAAPALIADGVSSDARAAELKRRIDNVDDAKLLSITANHIWFWETDSLLIEAVEAADPEPPSAEVMSKLRAMIAEAAIDVFVTGGNRRLEIGYVRDSVDREWIISGGLSTGDAPTDVGPLLDILDALRISYEPILAFGDGVPLSACPGCGSGTVSEIWLETSFSADHRVIGNDESTAEWETITEPNRERSLGFWCSNHGNCELAYPSTLPTDTPPPFHHDPETNHLTLSASTTDTEAQ